MKEKIKFVFNRKFYIGLATIALSIVCVLVIMFSFSNKSTKDPAFVKYNNYYDGKQVQIDDTGTAAAINTISMTEAAQANSNNNKDITISSFDELMLFSTKCNSNNSFLGYNYYLISNIEWDSQEEFLPIGTSANPFSGTFNGQGYEIAGLKLYLNNSNYGDGIYYSMFNYLSGEVTNLGLSHPELKVLNAPSSFEAGGFSYFVGENNGTISNSFVVDDGDALKELAGISVSASNARVSDLVVINKGTISNCYVVTSRVYNITQNESVSQYNQIAINNTGTISNTYFYDESIRTLTPGENNKAAVTYKTAYKMTDKTNDYFGTYSDSVNSLINSIDQRWYTKNDYGAYKDYTGIKYGLMRGISLSNTTFTINNEKDFAYMYELFNADDKFASNELTYTITANLNLAKLPVTLYTYKKGIGATIVGSTISGTPTMANGSTSTYPTIYNADVINSERITKSTGVDCYGLFNYLTGTVENLNVVPQAMDFSSIETSTNAKGIGVLSGYIEGGHVKNVNVYANITNTSSRNIGEYYVGGICGILGGNGKINGATSAGSITLPATSTTLQSNSSYMGGVAIGGIVGYVESSNGALYTCLNAMDITSKLGASITYAIGGVIGAGYTMNYDKTVVNGVTTELLQTGQLENVGTISIGDSTYHTYSDLYVAGIIGRHTGELDEVSKFTNNGNVTVYSNGTGNTYVCGVENADIISTAINNTKVEASQFKDGAGNTLFYASSLANGGEISVTGSSTKLQYTNVLNLKASNNVKSKLSDLYNLSYGYKYTGNAQKTLNKLSTQTISMNLHTVFAPVLNVIGGTSQYTTEAVTLYNLRDLTFNLTSAISSATTFNYTGCALGEYITYGDIKNEGKLTVNLSAGVSTASTLKVSGLFETLSNGCKAKNLYNGGDIKISEPNGSTASKSLDMYLSGICYQNLSLDSSEEQNPLNANFKSTLDGTMDSVINNGNITVESYYLKKDTATNVAPSTQPHFVSNIYVGGISYTNSGIISNAFNLGNIDVGVYSSTAKRYEAGGISCVLNGQYAQIRDSANNGNIYVIDLGGKVETINSIVNVGGIVGKNTGTSTNNSEVIAFTINYGTIIGFLARDNMSTTTYANAHAVASGILGTGFCNMVNIVNYGNVYGKECVAGIMGIVRLGLYNNNYTSTIANTLNYGQVKIIPPYDNSQQWATYNVILSLNTVRSNEYNLMYTHAGSICSIFDFSSRNNVTIRYLINLYNGELTVFSSLNTPTVPPDVSTFITTKSATDTFGGENNRIPYAPLSTLEENSNIGVFSSAFSFRKAINGIGLDSNYVTDSYIANFFQFVKFDKVNQSLLDTIGWRTIAYANAAEDLVKNVSALSVLVDKGGSQVTSLLSDAFSSNSWISNCDLDILDSLFTASFESGILDDSINEMLEYILFDTSATSSYTLAIRRSIVDKILEFYEKQGNNDYYEILQSMLYDTLLAKVVAEDNANYAAVKEKIKEVLANSNQLEDLLYAYMEALESDSSILNTLFIDENRPYYETQKINLVTTLLEGYDDSTLETLYNALNLTPEDEDSSLKYKLYLQQHQSEAANIYAHLIVNNSLSSNSNYLSWSNKNLDKYNVSSMLDSSSLSGTVDSYGNITSLTGYKYSPVTSNNEYNSTNSQLKTIRQFEAADITSLNITPTKDYRNLWNIIKTDEGIQNYISLNYFTTVKNPNTDLDESGIIAKATEYTNTYQTNDRTMSDYGMIYNFDAETNGRSFYERTTSSSTKYYGGINYGYNNQNYNFFGGHSYGADYPLRTRFIFTPDNYVTYRTNYLGPYATKTGIVYDQKISKNNNGIFFSGNQFGYKKGANLAATDESTVTARGTVPVFIGLDPLYANNAIASSGTNATDTELYRYYWNDHNGGGTGVDASSDYMWKHENFVTLAASNTTGFIYKNYNSGTYMCDYYNFDPTYVPTVRSDDTNTTNLPNIGSKKLINDTGANHSYRQHYLTAYCTAAVITGLYYTYSSWPNGGVKCVSLLAKRDGTYAWNKVSNNAGLQYCGVHTTDYICYSIEDLVKLDGYKTKGFNATLANNNDQDETNIIGAIVQKLLTDNKGLVLKAIANYSIDNDFTASDSYALNMLLTSIGDTEFAKTAIIESIPEIRDMNYSGLQSIATYLESLNINFTRYEDKIVISTVSNQTNFKNLLMITLDEYSKKSSDYAAYNLYNRDDINNFIYRYLTYLYNMDATITESEIDAILAVSSDSDLQKLEDLLVHIKNSIKYYDDELYEYNDVFTLYDITLYSRDDEIYSSSYDTNYSAVMVAGDKTTIDFYTGNSQYGYKLEVTYKGTIDLDGNDSHTSNVVTTYTFNGLNYNSSYTLYADEDTEIYDLKLKIAEFSGYSNDYYSTNESMSPFATITGTNSVSSVNFVEDGDSGKHTFSYGHYYSQLWKTNSETKSEMYIKISKGENITYNSINISFKTLSYFSQSEKSPNTVALYYNNNGSKATYNSYNGSLNISSTNNGQFSGLYQTSYTTTLPASLLSLLSNSDCILTLYIAKPTAYWNNNAAFSVNDFIIEYDFDFVNNPDDNSVSNVVLHQNLFNPYYSNTIRSSYTITNSNDHCGVDISGGKSQTQSLTFSDDSPTIVYSTNTKQIDAALTFEPWYNPVLLLPESLYSQFDLTTIDFGGDSIKEHFINGKYDVSDVAKYLVKDYFTEILDNNTYYLSNESFVEFHATSGGTSGNITVYDNEDIELLVIPIDTLEDEYIYYEVTLSSGTYKFVADSNVSFDMGIAIPTNISIDYQTTNTIDSFKMVSGDDEITLLELDYSKLSDPLGTGSSTPSNNNINTVGDNNLVAFNTEFSTSLDNYSLFYNVYPYKRNTNTTKTTIELRNNDIFNSVITFMATIHQDSTNSSYYSIFKDSQFDDEELIQVIKLLSLADNIGNNSAYKKFVDGLDSSYYQELLVSFDIEEVKINLAKKIYSYATNNSSLAKYIYAAYLGNDYIDHVNQYLTSLMYTLLNQFNAPDDNPDLGTGGYQFITSNSSVDADKVTALIAYLSSSSNVNIDGYGIFALSSSEGIGYGIFIPDNLTLSTMDSEYYYNNSNNILMLGDDDEAYWRGGESINLGEVGSVDYAFYHDMKQLVKSISTDIFELNVTANSLVLNSVDDQIDNVNKVITYYLTSGLGSIYNASSITINNGYRLANGATLSSTTISLTGSNTIKTQGVSVVVNDALVVSAEDTGVSSRYTLRFIAIDPSGLTLSSNVNSIGYNGGEVTLSLSGSDLPDGLDIEPYIVLTVNGVEYKTIDGYWKLDPGFNKNGVVSNGNATIKLIIDKSLPGGTDALDITINLANSPSVVLTKTQNTEKLITSFGFVPFGAANQDYDSNVSTSITSTIPYGRAYNYTDLTDYNSDSFYLYKFSVSDNASVSITATKTVLSTGLMRYVVTYKITAEAGGSAKTYTHTLNESTYFAENTQYASIYADGDEVTKISTSAYNVLAANEKPKYLYGGTLDYQLQLDEAINKTFDSRETYYKINYSVASVNENTFTTNGSLYTLSNGIYNKVTSGSYNSSITYYKRNYETRSVTAATYKTDGSLYRLVNGEYVQVLNGSFDQNVIYYGLQYVVASPTITSQTFTTNGSLYTRSGSGNSTSPYVYEQVIDRRDINDEMYASVAFNRTDAYGNSIEPQYRIKYSLSNFYTIGNNVEFGTTDSTLGNLATTNITYAGLTVTVSENNDTGTYKFIYTYKNTGIWENDEAYIRYYEFPEFIVEKQASTDALLHKLTFLEESIVLGNTATVILPTVPLVPDKTGEYYDNTEAVYKDQFESTSRQIVVSATGIKYNGADATSITDYYAVGTVSDADLSYYCPGFEINEYAQVYQYTTYKKLTEYGLGKQEDSDKNILSVHDNMYLYVPYILNDDTVILLVELDENGYFTNVYTTDYAGSRYIKVTSGSYVAGTTYYQRSGNDYVPVTVTSQTFTTNGSLYTDSLLYTYDANYVNARNAYTNGEFGNYKVSEVAGQPDKNSSLYMDYAGTPLDGHFWYVSYVVFSEDALCGGNSKGNVRYYHISIVDATNNVQFDVTIYADTTFNLGDIYFTISETTYKKVNEVKTETGKRQISAYADDTLLTYTGNRYDISGFKIYELKYKLQTLPSGYFYFYVDLPDGYIAEARTNKTNNISVADQNKYPGAFDPQTSIITVKIELEIVIKKGTNEDSNVWAFNTTDIYTREAEYKGTIVG